MKILIGVDISLRKQVERYEQHMTRTMTYYAPLALTYVDDGYLIRDPKQYSVRCSISSELHMQMESSYNGNIYEEVFVHLWRGVSKVFREDISSYVFVYPENHTYFTL